MYTTRTGRPRRRHGKGNPMTSSRPEQDYSPISDYGLIGDMHSCALVSKAGSIDWCCLPRFDSAAVFSRILDWGKGGYLRLAPQGVQSIRRRYLEGTNVLETTFQTDTGIAKLTDFMPVHPHVEPAEPLEVSSRQQIIRILESVSGSVRFVMECYPRFDYGTIIPHAILDGPRKGFAHGGADALSVYCSAALQVVDNGFRSDGLLRSGEKLCLVVTCQPYFSHTVEAVEDREIERLLDETIRYDSGGIGRHSANMMESTVTTFYEAP